MLRYLPYAVVSLLGVISLGWGGHSPWSILLLELGAAGLLLWVLLEVLCCTGREARTRNLERRRTWRKLPFRVRHPSLASFMRLLSLGLLPARQSTAEIEILLPGHQQATPDDEAKVDSFFFAGYRFRRARVATPLLLITVWIAASLLPLNGGWLQRVSPHALSIRSAAESLIQSGETPTVWPWSLAAFLTERALCLWIAYLALFYVGVCVAADPNGWNDSPVFFSSWPLPRVLTEPGSGSPDYRNYSVPSRLSLEYEPAARSAIPTITRPRWKCYSFAARDGSAPSWHTSPATAAPRRPAS